LTEVRRVLQPKGIFGLGMIEGDTEEYRISTKVQKPRLFAYYRHSELKRILEKDGFEVFYFETLKPGSRNYLHYLTRKAD